MHTDMKKSGWIERTPASLRPYLYLMRLDRPIGILLLLLPCLWGLALAPVSAPLRFYIFFILGAILMRGAGCIINDIWDRNIDKQVARTRTRPFANGDITLRRATAVLFGILLISLTILLTFNTLTIIIGVISIPLIILYPLMKRITYWPQIFLGLTFNIGVLMGWSAVTGAITLAPVCLYLSAIFWTLIYDTLYAYQDIEDDMRVGVKSSAIAIHYDKRILYAFMIMQCALLLSASYIQSHTFYTVLFFIPAFIAEFYCIKTCILQNAASALRGFKHIGFAGLLIWFGLLFI